MIKLLGYPKNFLSLSCAELKWKEIPEKLSNLIKFDFKEHLQRIPKPIGDQNYFSRFQT